MTGQVLHGGALEDSAEATVLERAGRIKGATMEIKSIIEEFSMQAMGGLMAAWELWERAIIPSLLSGAGTWFGPGDGKAAVDQCDKLQNFFWRVILTVPESCPKIALRCETQSMGMKWRIWQEKLLLLFRIRNKDTSTLCRQIYEEGKRNGWPGLGVEVAEICKEIGLPDLNENNLNKSTIKKAIADHHYRDVKQELEKSNKLGHIKDEEFHEVQEYFHEKSVEKGRMAFKVRSHMVQDIPGNFKEKFRKKGDGLNCKYCDESDVMTQSHCLVCPAWAELRVGLSMDNIGDLVIFFQKLLAERTRLDKLSV